MTSEVASEVEVEVGSGLSQSPPFLFSYPPVAGIVISRRLQQ